MKKTIYERSNINVQCAFCYLLYIYVCRYLPTSMMNCATFLFRPNSPASSYYQPNGSVFDCAFRKMTYLIIFLKRIFSLLLCQILGIFLGSKIIKNLAKIKSIISRRHICFLMQVNSALMMTKF